MNFCKFYKCDYLPQKRILAPKISFSFFVFFFFVGKNLLLYMVMLEKVADRGFLAFWPFGSEWKFRKSVKLSQKIWNLAESEYYPFRHHLAARLYSLCTACLLILNTSTKLVHLLLNLECMNVSLSYKLLRGSPIFHY